MRLRGILAVILTAALAPAGVALAQTRGDEPTSLLNLQRQLDSQLERQRREQAPISSLLDWQWGGWVDYYLFDFDDGVQSQRLLQKPGFAFWSKLSIDQGAHEFFARVRMRYSHYDPGDEIEKREDWQGPNFDLAWYETDVLRALRLGGSSDRLGLKVRIGRQSVLFGTGYALDLPLDAVQLDARLADLRVRGLFGKTIASYPNIDRSEPVDTHSHRLFYGVQASYEGLERHVPFVYAIWNDDKTDERPTDWYQNYSYDSFYAGGGAQGELWKGCNYWAEAVYESGRSYGDGNFLRRDVVEAYGWDAGVEQVFEVHTRPRLSVEYMFASGDSDRLFSPTNAAGGNRRNREDTSFSAFGVRDTGLAAAPLLSDIHIWKAGAAFRPLQRLELFRGFEIGTSWFVYQKNRRRAAISDPLADEYSGYVGWEMDYFANWRISSDLAWTLRWGQFFPGSAFSDDDDRHFLFTGFTWSF